MKIAIVIQGGCLLSVFCDNPGATVELVDLDQGDDEEKSDVAEARAAELPLELSAIYLVDNRQIGGILERIMPGINGYLVVVRCTMDDLPIQFVSDVTEAREIGRSLTKRRARSVVRRVDPNINLTELVCSAIIPFVNGYPQALEIVKEF
jgi:hypothetical protein